MQRIIPFGREYAQSAEFSVDEGQKIKFWLVREDYTTTIGEAEAELQIKSAVGNDRWTTLEVLNDNTKPYYDLEGTDENVVYRWVRKAGMPSFAIDRSQDGAFSRTQRAPVDPSQPNFDAATAVIFKAQAETLGDFTGVFYDFQNDGVNTFGNIVSTLPSLGAGPGTDSFVKAYYDTDTQQMVFEAFEDLNGAGATNVDWSDYIGGSVGIASECLAFSPNAMTSTTWNLAEEHVTDNGFSISIPDASGQFAPLAGTTFFVFFMKAGQAYPTFNLGARTGRFMLDQNDLPARLTAQPFDTSTEQVALSAVEGNVVIPLTYNEEGDPIRLVSTFRGYTIVAPGEYEWERSCNSSPGVYLNTGWRA